MFDPAALWDILKDPDAYYLRLRGEVAELAHRSPGHAWLEYVTFVPDLFRLHLRLLIDNRVSNAAKIVLLLCLLYLVAPLDFVPEALLGAVGYVDDVWVLSLGLARLTSGKAVPQALLEEHWSGTPGQLATLISVSEYFGNHIEFFKLIEKWLEDVFTFR